MKVIDVDRGMYSRTEPIDGTVYYTKEIDGEDLEENQIFISKEFIRLYKKWMHLDEIQFEQHKAKELRSRIEWEEHDIEQHGY